jgi:NAD(P)-dependent dehydrogenase (short-subunit alcohol dehydrogenase family)
MPNRRQLPITAGQRRVPRFGTRQVCLNAGIVGAALGAPWEAPGEWNHLLAVNLGGWSTDCARSCPACWPRVGPAVLITASLAGLATFPGGGAYAATKHAVVAVAEQTALALAETPGRSDPAVPGPGALGHVADGRGPGRRC